MARHDETARIEQLLSHAEWLRTLAARLVRDGDPEDLVQETWVAALRKPPRGTAGQVRPWLFEVLRNLVRRRWRSARVRRRAGGTVASGAEPAEAPSPQDLYERASLQRELTTLVLELEEPYRSAVLLRYFEGKAATEIATSLGIPAGTVRWRLSEGIERLRRSLDHSYGGERSRWHAALAPLALPTVKPDQPAAAVTGGMLLMATKAKGLVGVVVALLVVLLAAGVWHMKTGRTGTGSPNRPVVTSGRGHLERGIGGRGMDGDASQRSSVTVVVLDPEGQLVAGAEVALMVSLPPGTMYSADVVASGRSDRKGAFRFDGLASGEYLASATAIAHVAGTSAVFRVAPRDDQQVEIRLSRGGALLEGRVLDEGGGTIPAARVSARIGFPWNDVGPSRLYQTTADSEGRYRLRLPTREYTLRAQASGYAPYETTVAVTRDLIRDLRLNPAAVVSGRVFDRQNQNPAMGAEVQLVPGFRERGSSRKTYADADGRFSFSDADAGRYQVVARLGSLTGMGPTVSAIPTQAITGVTIPMDRGLTVSGRVTDTGGRALAAVVVTGGGAPTQVTADDGSFRLEGLPPGRHRLSAEGARAGFMRAERSVEIKDRDIGGLELELEPGATVAGRVLGAHGGAAPGILVRAEPKRRGAFIRRQSEVSGADGGFRLRGLDNEAILVTAWDPVLGTASVEVGPLVAGQEKSLDLHLRPGAGIAGIVKFDDGTPAGDIGVAVTRQEGMVVYDSATTGRDGRFRVRSLVPGQYTVVANRKRGPWNLWTSRERPDLRLVTVADGEEKTDVVLTLSKGGNQIAGTVVLADGLPAAGTLVIANREQNGSSWKPSSHQIENSGMVRDDGRFLIDDVEAGTFWLWAVRPGFADLEVKGIAAGRRDVHLELPAPAKVAGVVATSDGSAVAQYTVILVPAERPGETVIEKLQREERSRQPMPVLDPTGAFEVVALAAGTYDLKVVTPEGRAARQTVILAAGEEKRGLRLVIERGIEATGRVVELGSSAALADVRVYVQVAGMTREVTRSDAEGKFQIEGLTPGEPVSFRLVADSDDLVPEYGELTLPPGAGKVDLGTFRLLRRKWSERVRDQGTFGLRPRPRDGRFTIETVTAGLPAAQAGIKPGDTVVAVESHDVRGLGPGAIHHLMTRRPGETLSITVQSPGAQPRNVSLTADDPNLRRSTK